MIRPTVQEMDTSKGSLNGVMQAQSEWFLKLREDSRSGTLNMTNRFQTLLSISTCASTARQTANHESYHIIVQWKQTVAGQADPDSKKEEKNADFEKALSSDYTCAVEPPVRPCSST